MESAKGLGTEMLVTSVTAEHAYIMLVVRSRVSVVHTTLLLQGS